MTWKRLVARAKVLLAREDAGGKRSALGVHLLRHDQPTEFEASIYDPIVCLILQGAKETTLGDRVFTVEAGHCVVVSHDVPVLARITRATPDEPYLALVIALDLAVLRSLYDKVGPASEQSSASCMEVAPVDDATVDVIGRYLALLDDPVAARVLLPLVKQDLHFRLFTSPSGGMLRGLLRSDSHASHISHAIRLLREGFRDPLAVADLARQVGMSTSSFHKHFKRITMTTPLQYQKDLRLTEARQLIRTGRTVSEAAFEVGYESPSQFSREYARKFGRPPSRDLADAAPRHA